MKSKQNFPALKKTFRTKARKTQRRKGGRFFSDAFATGIQKANNLSVNYGRQQQQKNVLQDDIDEKIRGQQMKAFIKQPEPQDSENETSLTKYLNVLNNKRDEIINTNPFIPNKPVTEKDIRYIDYVLDKTDEILQKLKESTELKTNSYINFPSRSTYQSPKFDFNEQNEINRVNRNPQEMNNFLLTKNSLINTNIDEIIKFVEDARNPNNNLAYRARYEFDGLQTLLQNLYKALKNKKDFILKLAEERRINIITNSTDHERMLSPGQDPTLQLHTQNAQRSYENLTSISKNTENSLIPNSFHFIPGAAKAALILQNPYPQINRLQNQFTNRLPKQLQPTRVEDNEIRQRQMLLFIEKELIPFNEWLSDEGTSTIIRNLFLHTGKTTVNFLKNLDTIVTTTGRVLIDLDKSTQVNPNENAFFVVPTLNPDQIQELQEIVNANSEIKETPFLRSLNEGILVNLRNMDSVIDNLSKNKGSLETDLEAIKQNLSVIYIDLLKRKKYSEFLINQGKIEIVQLNSKSYVPPFKDFFSPRTWQRSNSLPNISSFLPGSGNYESKLNQRMRDSFVSLHMGSEPKPKPYSNLDIDYSRLVSTKDRYNGGGKKTHKRKKKQFQMKNKKRTFRKSGKRKSLRGGFLRRLLFGKPKEQIEEENTKAKEIIQNCKLNEYFEYVKKNYTNLEIIPNQILNQSICLYQSLKNFFHSTKEEPSLNGLFLFNEYMQKKDIKGLYFQFNKCFKKLLFCYDQLFLIRKYLNINNSEPNLKLYKDLKNFFEFYLYSFIEILKTYTNMSIRLKKKKIIQVNLDENGKEIIIDDLTNGPCETNTNLDELLDINGVKRNENEKVSRSQNPENLNNNITNETLPSSDTPDGLSQIKEKQTDISSLPATQEPQNQDSSYTAGGRGTRKKMQHPNKKPTLYIL
jgi:hypothetical protein